LQPVTNWNGFYANVGVGYGLWDAQTTTEAPGRCVSCAATDHSGRGWLGEVGLGYDRRVSDRIVAGVLFNYDFSDMLGKTSDAVFTTGDTRNDSTWFVGARVGWLMTPDILNYWSVGYTRTHFSGASLRNSFTGAELPSELRGRRLVPRRRPGGGHAQGMVLAQRGALRGLQHRGPRRDRHLA
jgi:outer membrane immunogenic protein